LVWYNKQLGDLYSLEPRGFNQLGLAIKDYNLEYITDRIDGT